MLPRSAAEEPQALLAPAMLETKTQRETYLINRNFLRLALSPVPAHCLQEFNLEGCVGIRLSDPLLREPIAFESSPLQLPQSPA